MYLFNMQPKYHVRSEVLMSSHRTNNKVFSA